MNPEGIIILSRNEASTLLQPYDRWFLGKALPQIKA